MNVAQLIVELDRNGVDIESYSLNHGDLILDHIGLGQKPYGTIWLDGKWCLYFRSDKETFDITVFNDESSACHKFLDRVLRITEMRHKYGRMNKDDLQNELVQAGVNSWYYSLDGSNDQGDQVVIRNDIEGQWIVSDSERGIRSKHISFKSESEACIHCLDRLIAAKERMDMLLKKSS